MHGTKSLTLWILSHESVVVVSGERKMQKCRFRASVLICIPGYQCNDHYVTLAQSFSGRTHQQGRSLKSKVPVGSNVLCSTTIVRASSVLLADGISSAPAKHVGESFGRLRQSFQVPGSLSRRTIAPIASLCVSERGGCFKAFGDADKPH